MTTILVVDDVAPMAEQYAYDLARLGGYQTRTAGGGAAALELMAHEPVDCVILDLEMPDMDGFEVLRALARREVRTPVIVYTGTGNFDRCVEATRLGAWGFIDKAEPIERVLREVANALEHRRLQDEVQSLRRDLGRDGALIGSSAVMLRLREAIGRLAPIPSPVLIAGESGSGKELVAQELHRRGRHPNEPFVAVNSAALPEQLVESELFGHERGAFTGADRLRKGAFEAAGRGTLFLDEIGELPLPAQAKLLRVLEERQLTRLGGSRVLPVEARVVAASNRDLEAEVAAGRFREDLLYRLNVHMIQAPPLRDRLDDLPELLQHFVETLCARFGLRTKRCAPGVVARLQAYHWGRNNVREFRNIVERMIIAAEGEVIELAALPQELRQPASGAAATGDGPATLAERKAAAERAIVLEALERNSWHITNTARELGLADHASLLKIMRRLGLSRAD